MKFEIGDVVMDVQLKRWIIYDIVDYSGINLLCVTDLKTQEENEVIEPGLCMLLGKQPSNVKWMFIERRERNLKGLEQYL